MILIVCVLLPALVFEYLNGFHDTANAIATIVATKVMTPRQAIGLGIPLSTTHVVRTCIMGVGVTKGLRAIKWTTVESMLGTWVLTLPATAFLGYALCRLSR